MGHCDMGFAAMCSGLLLGIGHLGGGVV